MKNWIWEDSCLGGFQPPWGKISFWGIPGKLADWAPTNWAPPRPHSPEPNLLPEKFCGQVFRNKKFLGPIRRQKKFGAQFGLKLWDYHISRFWVGQWLSVSVICSPGTPQNEELCPNDQQWGHTGSKITITGIIIGEIVYKIFVMSWLLTCFVIGPWFLLQCFMHQNWIGMVQ